MATSLAMHQYVAAWLSEPPAASSLAATSTVDSEARQRRKALEQRIRIAQERASLHCTLPICYGRCSLAGLAVLELLRMTAWWQGTIPGNPVLGMHFLTTASDFACILCALPFYSTGTEGQCVSLGCLGPMLTLVFAMALVDASALCAYLVIATPRPLAPGARSYLDMLEACIGAWEFALVGSVAFQTALCACSWRVYRELREAGLYPPGTDPAGVGTKIREVSCMEVVCDAEDVEYISNCTNPRHTPDEPQAGTAQRGRNAA